MPIGWPNCGGKLFYYLGHNTFDAQPGYGGEFITLLESDL